MSGTAIAVLPSGGVFHGRYEIVRCIKLGGMGAVYECIHQKTRRRRALKVMLPAIVADDDMRARFELEARVTAEIESEHIVETFDAGIDDETGSPFLVMELLRGEDLAATLERGNLTPEDTVSYLAQAARALDRTHAAGIVHRDLKPENLFVSHREDGSAHVKILDFGIAKVVAQSAQTSRQTAMLGTPLFMSPEQIEGDGAIDPRADVYALGHIAFALLVGDAYWGAEQRATTSVYSLLLKIMAGPTERATARAARRGVALPPTFDTWFSRATALSPDDRFDKASDLVAELGVVFAVPVPRASTATSDRRGPDAATSSPSHPGYDKSLAQEARSAAQSPGVRVRETTPNGLATKQPTPSTYQSGPRGTARLHGAPAADADAAFEARPRAQTPTKSASPSNPRDEEGSLAGDEGSRDPAPEGVEGASIRMPTPVRTASGVVIGDARAIPMRSNRPLLMTIVALSLLTGFFAAYSFVHTDRAAEASGPSIATDKGKQVEPSRPTAEGRPAVSLASDPAPPGSIQVTPASAAVSVSGPPVEVKHHRPSSAASKPACDPPYEVDAAGHRHMKPQCL